LVRALHDRGEPVLLTSFTATGYQSIGRNFTGAIRPGIIPIDFIWNCRRFFHQQPIRLCLLMETELWPELLYQAARRGIPIVQVNARLSHKSLGASSPVRSILQQALGYISLHLVRNERDRDHLIQLGVDSENIKIIGNLKSSIDVSPTYPDLIGREYLLLASSHEDEEMMLLSHRPSGDGKLLIVIAPRHPQRRKTIQQQLSQLGVKYSTRSLGQVIDSQTEVYLADTLGELKALMTHARIVIMGGSFDQTGGHNLIEPAALACAIITGPSDDNIREDIKLLGKARGIIQVPDMDACWQAVEHLLNNPDVATRLGVQAQQAVLAQSGILDAYLNEIEPWL
jgi:3-deoxy-D-manno-octulosonic-acid transferase